MMQAVAFAAALIALSTGQSPAASAGTVVIHVDAAHRVQTIRPIRTFGTSVDSDPKGKIPLLFSPSRVKLMLSTGLGMLTYRLYTELSIQDWHWNPSGRYSDAAHQQFLRLRAEFQHVAQNRDAPATRADTGLDEQRKRRPGFDNRFFRLSFAAPRFVARSRR